MSVVTVYRMVEPDGTVVYVGATRRRCAVFTKVGKR